MKKWNNPELLSLGVENTFSDTTENCFQELTTFKNGQNTILHWCHAANNGNGDWVDNTSCTHPRSNHHNNPDQPEHDWAGNPKISKCCCGKKQTVPELS